MPTRPTKQEYLRQQEDYWEDHVKYHPANAFCGSAGPEEQKHLAQLLSTLSDTQVAQLAKQAGIKPTTEVDRIFYEGVIGEIDKEDFYRLYHQIAGHRALRDFQWSPDSSLLWAILDRFTLYQDLSILGFTALTPDSFMWRLLVDDIVYYLYAEDYVPGLKHVTSVITQHAKAKDWEFVPPQHSMAFEDASPVRTARVFKKPEDADEMMRYATDSGPDFVFLIKSTEEPYA